MIYNELEKSNIKHGESLKAIFNVDIDAKELFHDLRGLEIEAGFNAGDLCNGELSEKEFNNLTMLIELGLVEILGFQALEMIFFNSDPRGYPLDYTLKIKSEFTKGSNIHRDKRGYGILAPDFS